MSCSFRLFLTRCLNELNSSAVKASAFEITGTRFTLVDRFFMASMSIWLNPVAEGTMKYKHTWISEWEVLLRSGWFSWSINNVESEEEVVLNKLDLVRHNLGRLSRETAQLCGGLTNNGVEQGVDERGLACSGFTNHHDGEVGSLLQRVQPLEDRQTGKPNVTGIHVGNGRLHVVMSGELVVLDQGAGTGRAGSKVLCLKGTAGAFVGGLGVEVDVVALERSAGRRKQVDRADHAFVGKFVHFGGHGC
ncbi:hypothetical protein OGAPHI_003807 [Ogataea philodendri]|uniref:Uncharacterized protein n=1 Tax=Ogataea philodendri TaxID=1378263 RepID=A0A9P8P611_9ASCO|nr:uncharacterized protein OGAPHI_003807 [Ogataea philodendri]KAH3665619.1 hypothetical protein OGAPHI_003807 [Ogataea philodendri]